jgi:hypothetical protein
VPRAETEPPESAPLLDGAVLPVGPAAPVGPTASPALAAGTAALGGVAFGAGYYTSCPVRILGLITSHVDPLMLTGDM